MRVHNTIEGGRGGGETARAESADVMNPHRQLCRKGYGTLRSKLFQTSKRKESTYPNYDVDQLNSTYM